MNIYVFEPYNWGYCGGAIVVIALSEQRAHELIWERQKHEHEARNPEGILRGLDGKVFDWSWEAKKDSFAERFKQNEEDGNCWELTSVIQCYTPVYVERVICYNYNYA